ncbi:MAG TPA: YraN family protein [Candidatus Nanopelagicaceae bacterium]
MSIQKKSPHSSKSQNISLGAFGENAVTQYLISSGATILDRNWRVREGEIDIVAQSPDGKVIFVEVKTRSSLAFGHPLESITNRKAHRLQSLALAWLVTHKKFGADFQIDAAAVLIGSRGEQSIDYRANVL